MSAMEINKIVAAVLVAGLVIMVINIGVDLAYKQEPTEKLAIALPGGEAPAAETATAEASTTETPAPQPPTTEAAAPAQGTGQSGPTLAALLATADPGKGAKLFKKCTACHNAAPDAGNKVGPNLWGVVGAKVARRAGFRYSKALKAHGGTWTYAALFTFIEAPKKAVPGTKMGFRGFKDASKRANLLAYLRTLADSPAPLPTD